MLDQAIRPEIYTRDLVEAVLGHYDLAVGTGLNILPMPQGFGMALVRLQQPGFDLVLKQLSPVRPLERILFALRFQTEMNSAGLPCPRLITTRDGSPLLSLHGQHFCLQEWCPGERFQPDKAGPEERRHHRRQLGTLLGRVHEAASCELLAAAPPSCRRPPELIFTQLPDVEKGLPWSRGGSLAQTLWLHWREPGDLGREVREVLPVLKAARTRLVSSPLVGHPQLADTLPVHGDFHLDNVLFQDREVSRLLDFDNATVAPRAFDLGSALAVICQEREHEADFLTAYAAASGRQLPAEDLLRACVLARLVNSLSIQLVAYTRRQTRSTDHARRWIRRLSRLLTIEFESA